MGRKKKEPMKGAIEIVSDLASRGCSEVSISKALGVSFPTWKRWREDRPELQEAYERARAVEHDQLVGKLFELATAGNVVAAIFLLKARHGYRDGGVTIEDNRQLQVGIVLPASLNQDQYQKLIESATNG